MINEKDLIINTFRDSSLFPKMTMRITHKSSGIIVHGDGIGNQKLKVKLIKELELKLKEQK